MDQKDDPKIPGAPRVLMYHSISPSTAPDPDHLRVHPDVLDRQLRHLRRRGLRGVSAQQWLKAAAAGEASKLVALTFDDGYRDFVEHAMPVLARHAMTGSVYVVAGKLEGTSDWVRGGPHAQLMGADDVHTAAAAGHEIGSHTSTHARLPTLDAAGVRREITESRQILQEILQRPVDGFAYPYGDFLPATIDAVRQAGHTYAIATDEHRRPTRFTIPRFYVGQRDGALRLEAKFVRHRLRAVLHAAAR